MNSKEKSALRKKLYVNREVQGALILRSVLHWYFYMVAILLTVSIITVIQDPSKLGFGILYDSFMYFAPAIIASIVLLPVFVYDIMKTSNRVAGPIVRLRNEMEKLANGETVKKLRFRDGDHWTQLAQDFNVLAAQVMKERKAAGIETTPSTSAPSNANDPNMSLELVGSLVEDLQ